MRSLNVLIILDKSERKFQNLYTRNGRWNLFWLRIDYKNIYRSTNVIEEKINNYKIDFLLFSRNDQIKNGAPIGPILRKLKIGYSTFSAIDEQSKDSQQKILFDDFVNP